MLLSLPPSAPSLAGEGEPSVWYSTAPTPELTRPPPVRYRPAMTDTPDTSVTITDLQVENATLRGTLYITARRLKDFLDAPARKLGEDRLRITIPKSLHESGTVALADAQARLRDEGRSI